MHRRTFFKAAPAAAAVAAATAAADAHAKPLRRRRPPAPDAVPLAPPAKTAKLKLKDPPDSHVVLTPFQLMDGGVGIVATPRYMKIAPDGGALVFGPSENALTVLYPTPPLSMRGKALRVSVRGHFKSRMHVKLVARDSAKGPGKVVRQLHVRRDPKNNKIAFEVPSALLNAGARVDIELKSASGPWVLHNCTLVRGPSSPGRRAATNSVRP